MFSLRATGAPKPPQNPAEKELHGQLDRVFKVFENEDSQTVLAKLMDGRVVRGTVDTPDDLKPAAYYAFFGQWQEHDRYGWQFAFSGLVRDIPRRADGSASYLERH
jgi:hypothetical protein